MKFISGNERFLFVPPEGIGDNLMFLPVAFTLKKNFPNIFIAFLSNKANGASQIIKESKFVDDVIELGFKPRQNINYVKFILSDYWSLISTIKNYQFDYILTINKNLFRNLVTIPFYFKSLVYTNYKLNQIQCYFNTIRPFANIDNLKINESFFNKKASKRLSSKFELNKKYVVFSPFSHSKSRTIKNYLELIEILKKEVGAKYSIVVLGKEEIHHELNNIIDLTNKTSIGELLEIVAMSSFVIAVDSSIMHIGIYQDIPTLGIFGSVLAKYRLPSNASYKTFSIDTNSKDCAIESREDYFNSAIGGLEVNQKKFSKAIKSLIDYEN